MKWIQCYFLVGRVSDTQKIDIIPLDALSLACMAFQPRLRLDTGRGEWRHQSVRNTVTRPGRDR